MTKDQILREARTIEAMQKGYMGLEGKFAVIARYLGSPMFRQGTPLFEQNFLNDPFKNEEQIPTMEEGEDSYEIGSQFDGLSRGINISILIKKDLREITCYYEGKVVYKELSGDLDGYAPSPDWEDKILYLFSLANKVEKKNRPLVRQELISAANKERKRKLIELRDKWGL